MNSHYYSSTSKNMKQWGAWQEGRERERWQLAEKGTQRKELGDQREEKVIKHKHLLIISKLLSYNQNQCNTVYNVVYTLM